VIIFKPVLETFGVEEFTSWPVSDSSDSHRLVLSGDLTPDGVGTAMAIIADYNENILDVNGNEMPPASGAADSLTRLIRAECLLAPGGLRVRDTESGLTIDPGCCFGLENWRDWYEIADGESPWLGHDPSPWAEHLNGTIRIWPDEVREGETTRSSGSPIDITAEDFPELVANAARQLQDFLGLIGPWARPLTGTATDELVQTVDAHFRISRSPSDTTGSVHEPSGGTDGR
jgi:hypothetical protein